MHPISSARLGSRPAPCARIETGLGRRPCGHWYRERPPTPPRSRSSETASQLAGSPFMLCPGCPRRWPRYRESRSCPSRKAATATLIGGIHRGWGSTAGRGERLARQPEGGETGLVRRLERERRNRGEIENVGAGQATRSGQAQAYGDRRAHVGRSPSCARVEPSLIFDHDCGSPTADGRSTAIWWGRHVEEIGRFDASRGPCSSSWPNRC